jgi:hypothetical protein
MEMPRLDVEIHAIRYLAAVTAAHPLLPLPALAAPDELRPGSLLVALTDDHANPCTAVAVDDVPADPPQHSRVRALVPLLRFVAAELGSAGALLAVARHGDPRAQGGDLAWHDAFAGTSRIAGLACHGTYVVTPAGIRRVRPGPLVVAA